MDLGLTGLVTSCLAVASWPNRTVQDIEDAEFLLQLDPPIEYICVSFVQKGQDLQELIDIMDRLKIPQAGGCGA